MLYLWDFRVTKLRFGISVNGLLGDDYVIKWSNEWSLSVGQGCFLIRHNKNLQIRINGYIIKLKLLISNL